MRTTEGLTRRMTPWEIPKGRRTVKGRTDPDLGPRLQKRIWSLRVSATAHGLWEGPAQAALLHAAHVADDEFYALGACQQRPTGICAWEYQDSFPMVPASTG